MGQALREGSKLRPLLRQLFCWAERDKSLLLQGQLRCGLLKPVAQNAFKLQLQSVESLGVILQSLVRPAQPSGHPTQSLLAPRERLPGQVAETLQQALQLLKRVQLVRAQQFGCCRRCRRPEICDQIGDGEVDFMADRRHDGQLAGKNGSGDGFFVERLQVLQRAAAPANDQSLRPSVSVSVLASASAELISPGASGP